MIRIYRFAGLIALAWFIGSCGGGDGIVGPPTPTTDRVTLSVNSATLVPGETFQFSAIALDKAGQSLPRTFAWSTSDAAKASVSSSGMVSGVAAGTAMITAAVDGKSASSTITVLDGGVVSSAGGSLNLHSGDVQIVVPAGAVAAATDFSIVPSTTSGTDPRLVKETSFDFGPTGTVFAKPVRITIKYVAGNVPPGTDEATLQLNVSTPSGWEIVDGSVVDTKAKTVTADVSHFSVYAILTPAPVATVAVSLASAAIQVGQTSQATALLSDAAGHVLTRAVAWSSDNSAVATVSAAGLVTGLAPGTATITATSEGKTAAASLSVTAIPVAALTISASTTPMLMGQTQQLTAVPKDASGNTLADRNVNWVSSNPAVLAVSSASSVSTAAGAALTVTAVGLGTATVTASSESAPSVATPLITVNPVPVASVALSPASATLVMGITPTEQMTATLTDAGNTVLTGRTVTWSSSNPSVATVDANGLVTAVGIGSTTVTATSEGQSGAATINVALAPVATVTVTLTSSSINSIQTTQATATLVDAQGHPLVDRAVVWSSDNTSVATVSSAGLVTAVAPGTTKIIATGEGKTGSAALTVTPAPVASVSVSPPSASMVPGASQQLTAVIKDANGTVVTGRPVTWTSSNPAAATVSTTGLVTAIAAGTATITATSEGQSGTSSITMSLAPVATVTVSLAPGSITAVGTSQATATTFDGNGNQLTGRTIAWTSSNTAVATVDAQGVVTAIAEGTSSITATSEGKSGSATISVSQAPVATVTVSLAANSITAVQTTQGTATLLDSRNRTLGGRTVTWSSDNTTVATVDAGTGLVTAVAPGTANIAATSEGKAGSAQITITPAPVASVTVSAPNTSMVNGASQQLTAVTKDAKGNVLTGRTVTWVSSLPVVLTVSASGVTATVTAVGVGSATITATSESVSSTPTPTITVAPTPVASVAVNLAPASITAVGTSHATATILDAEGHTLSGRGVTWSSSDVNVATVDDQGLVTAVAVGTASITAISEGKPGSANLTVTPEPVASITVSPGSPTLVDGSTVQLTAETRDSKGRLLTGRVISWSSGAPLVATVSATGFVTTVAPGRVDITAESEGKIAMAAITVTPIPVATVSVSLASSSLTAGQTTQATATTRDGSGNPLTGRDITWSSDNSSVATVSVSGVVTAHSVGSATITATSEGKSGSATVDVVPVPVGSVTVAPATATVISGATQQLSAATRDANNVLVTDRVVTWSSSNTAVATVSATGLVSAVSVGSATITATSEGKSGTSLITVVPVPVASVTVALSLSSITAVGTSQATATTLDSNGGVLSGRAVTWSSSNTAVATVSATGAVTAVAVGTADIIATSEGKSGSAPLTVTQAPVASVTLSPSSAIVFQGETEQLTPTLEDARHRPLSGRVVDWISSVPGVATVSPTGLVTAVAPGDAIITATSEGQSGTSSITVSLVPVATISVALSATTINVQQSAQATATLRDVDGNPLTGRFVTWSSDNTTVASVSNSGAITALAVGTAHITATSGGKSGSATLAVTPIPVATVSVSLTPNSVEAGQTTQAAAITRDANGNVLVGRDIAWSSDNTSVASVSASGLVTAIAPGSANIIATSEGKTGSAVVTVVPVSVASVTLSTPTTPVLVGATQTLTAIPKDVNGNPLAGRTVTWISSNPAVLSLSAASSVSTSGGATVVVTGVGVGTANITATSESATAASAAITVNPVPVASVAVTPSVAGLVLGITSTQQLTATLRDANNNVLSGRSVAWTSSSPSVATVDQNGLVTAVGGGSTTITATSESRSGTASITVTVPVAAVAVSPTAITLLVGATHQLVATTTDASGAPLSGRSVTWTSSDPATVTVSSTGLVTGVVAGTAVITATSEGKTGTSTITVTPIPVASVSVALATPIQLGQTTQATATTFDAGQNILTGRSLTWSTGNPAIASVSTDGMVTAVGVGSTSIIATSEGESGSATVDVIPVPVGSVTVAPATATVISGATQQLSAATRDANNVLVTDRVVTWSSSNTAVATVSATGLVSAVSVGSATITATSEGKSGTSLITVVPVPVASVTVALSLSSITAVGTSQATATTLDSNGGVLSGRAVTWSSSNTAVATVSATGAVTAVAVGTADIIATSEGKSGSAVLTVTQAPVASVSVAPSSAIVMQGGTEQLVATLRDARGSVLTRPTTWSSSDETVATVSQSGLVTAAAPGSATITATSEGQSGTSSLTVSPIPVAAVSVALASSTITDGQTTQATATVLDASGNPLTGRTVTWSSDNGAVATVSSAGVVTAIVPGTAQIRATSGGKTGSAQLTVIPRVAAVIVSPPAASVVVGTTLQLTAEPRDASNNVLTGRSVTWSSGATSVATVSASGLVTAASIGSTTITATSEGKTGTSSITVVPVPVALVTVSLASTTITVGANTQATATIRDASGTILTGRTVTWDSGNSAIATVSPTGVVSAIGAGSVQIIAMSEGKTGSATLTVNAVPVESVALSVPASPMIVGTTQVLTALPKDAGGNTLSDRTVNWVSSNTAVLTVGTATSVSTTSGATVTVNAVGTGAATITATSESAPAATTPTITVNPVPVVTVTVTLSPSSITAVGTSQASAQTFDGSGNPLTGRTITWTSNNSAVATVSPAGLVSGVAEGTASITATSEGRSGSATITVTPAPVATITVSLAASSINGVQATQASAALFDAQGRTLTGRTIIWSSSNTSVATVSSTGLVTAVAPGTANIIATGEGKTGSAALTVTPAPVATVTVSPPTASLVVGISSTQQLTAVTKDANGTVLAGRAVSWTSSNTAVATVSTTGLVTAIAAGTATITATSEGQSGTSSITVSVAPVATVTVSLAPGSITAVGTSQATATTFDGNGNQLTGRTIVWISSNTAVATVDAQGVVTAIAEGTSSITATSEGKSGSATISVSQAPVATVTVSLAANSITAVQTTQASATLLDSRNRTLGGRTVTWSSDNTAVATVDAVTGLVTAVAPGTANIAATSEGKAGGAQITVTPAPVATVTVGPATADLVLGITPTQQLTAVTKDAHGTVLSDRAITWLSSNPAAADVSASGLVTAVAAGSTTITATSEGQNGTSSVTVSLAPVTTLTLSAPTTPMTVGTAQTLTAVPSDANGTALSDRTVNWTSSNTAVLTVSAPSSLSNSSGATITVTAVGVGAATITASSESAPSVATPAITVNPVPVATVTVTPATASLVLGITTTQQLTAVTRDANNNVLTGRSITWSSSNTGSATVSTSGLVTAVAAGSATITATSEGQNGTSSITVSLAPVASVTVSAPTTPMLVGATQQLTAVTKDANGVVLTGRTISWASSNNAVLTVSPNGSPATLTAAGAGTATITATSEGVSSAPTATITVTQGLASGPLRVSTVNPRYFADQSGRIVYLTGSGHWNTLEDNGLTNPPRLFDFSKFLDFLQAHNHNFTRMFTWEHARWSSLSPIDHYFSPNPYPRTGPDTALDGGPKFDVSQLNPAYFARVRQRAVDAGARGIYVSIQLFDGWSLNTKLTGGNNPWKSHPFNRNNNINGIDGDPNNDQSGEESHTLTIPAILAIEEKYVKAVIDAVNDLDNVIFEISNESEQNGDAWQYHMIDLIRSYEATKPKQHPIGMTVPYPVTPSGTNVDVLNSTADWMSLNGDINNPSVADGTKVSLNDTDHICGICGDPSWPWKNFTRGHNTLLMDGYDGSPGYTDPAFNVNDPKWEAIRTQMGYTRSYALRMDLAHALPRFDLASSGYCLAVVGSEYLVFLPGGGSVTVNLTAVSGTRTVEWFNATTGQIVPGGTVTGGSSVFLVSPFAGMAALYIHP